MKIKGKITIHGVAEKKIFKVLKEIGVVIRIKHYGTTIQSILNNKHDKYDFAHRVLGQYYCVIYRDMIFEMIIMDDFGCRSCGGDLEVFDYIDDMDEIQPKIIKLKKRCVLCKKHST